MERNHRLELQYDGTGLHGWAKQEGLPTVEAALEEAFRTVLGRVPAWRVAGRTDAGVHARRQVLSLRLPADLDLRRLQRSLNALTPAGVAVVKIAPAPEQFDARADATSRTYRYFLSTGPVVSPFWTRYCWHLPVELDWVSMEAAAAAAAGRHDFTAFTPTETEHVFFERLVLRCRWRRVEGDFPGLPQPRQPAGLRYLEVEAEAFLRHMVRTLVGTMVEVGKGAMTLDCFEHLLAGAPRQTAGPTAPPQGLVLWEVSYGRRRRSA
jgi:tRNA pseudouridine38-40 synthase